MEPPTDRIVLDGVSDSPRTLSTVVDRPDAIFRWVARSGGTIVVTVMTLVGLFLLIRGFEAMQSAGPAFIYEQAWDPNSGTFGIAAVFMGTVFIALTAIFFALPLSFGTALYISEYAPQRIKPLLVTTVDLMAAIPSIVYGLWGFFFLSPLVLPLSQWLATYMGPWFPPFAVEGFDPTDPLATPTVFSASTFIAGIVVALMVAPITSSIMREVFQQAPLGEREGALALGATKWGMITSVVIPFGRGGIIGGTMLGLGRSLGETIAVFLIISPGVCHSAAHSRKGRQLDLGAHRSALQRGLRLRDLGPYGGRACPLHCDPHHQLRRLDHRRAQPFGKRGRLMAAAREGGS